MKKKLLSMVLAAVLTAAMLTGCGSEGTEETTAPAEETEAPAEEEAEAAEGEAEAETPKTDGEESALLKEIKDRGYITIATSNDAPFCYYDVDTNELKGLDVEILQEICNRLGIPEIQAQVTDFSNMLIELNNKNVDMVADAMYIKDERLEVALFTDVWYTEGEAITIRTDSEFTTKESLKDAVVGAQPGTAFYETGEQWVKEGKIKELVGYENQATLMTAVNAGKVDAVITDGIVSGYTISQDSSLELKLMSPYDAEAVGRIGAAVRFEDADFLAEVNGALNEMKEDGTLMKILESYGLTEDYFIGVEEGKTENVQ
ncbi:MAG: amino acid ABC transporter substrate-binding protein [Lachnospiraceae bacterium]|nr:amino acid ABC transporter substrate-binding protein [Lachnospiraceae bacterium]